MSSGSVMNSLHNGIRDLMQVFSANDLIYDYDLKNCNTMGISCHQLNLEATTDLIARKNQDDDFDEPEQKD